MATSPRSKGANRQAATVTAAPTGPAGRDWKIAVALGLLLGQAGYLYTRQPKRLAMSLLLGVLALALSFAACYHELPPMVDFDTIDFAELLVRVFAWAAKVSAAMTLPTLVSLLNNVACAVDLYLQVKRVKQAN